MEILENPLSTAKRVLLATFLSVERLDFPTMNQKLLLVAKTIGGLRDISCNVNSKKVSETD